MKLLKLYSQATGLDIGRQWLLESFYPLPTTRYITLHAASGMVAKNYPHYIEVMALIGHILNSQGIQIVQLGAKEDPAIPACVHLQGKTDYHQSSYILGRSMLHLGNDSWLAHRAGEQGVPLITLFGSTAAANHSAYSYNPDKTVFLESHRRGCRPTFASQENPLSIGFIPPEQVANAVLRLLGIADQFPFSTRFIGPVYAHTVFELIPNTVPAPTFFPGAPVTLRMDMLFSEDVLLKVLQTGRRIHVITNRPIDIGLLQRVRAGIITYTHELGVPGTPDTPVPYADAIKALFPQHNFFARLEGEPLAALRFRFFDHANILQQRDPTKADYVEVALQYLNRADTPENRLDLERELSQNRVRFKTNKFVLAGESIFLSHPHLAAGKSITSLGENTAEVIDDPALFRDIQHFLFTYHPPAP